MAFQFQAEKAISDQEDAWYEAKEFLKTHGWTVPSSSDGTTYNAAGDEITSVASFANDLAWMRLRAPDGSFELTVQQGTHSAMYEYRIKYSRGAGFTGGSPSATETPSATDEGIVLGGGTDDSPTFGALLDNFATPDWFHMMAEDVSPYRFWWVARQSEAETNIWGFVCDYADSPNPADNDPRVIFTPGESLDYDDFDGSTAHCWYDAGGAGEAFVNVVACTYEDGANNRHVPGNLQANVNGKDDILPIPISRSQESAGSVPYFFKGFSSVMKWPGTFRAVGTTYNVTGEKSHVRFGDIVFDWDGVTTPSA